MTKWYKVMLGKGSQHAQQAIEGGFIGVDDGSGQDLTPLLGLPEIEFREQVKAFLRIEHPGLSKGTISSYATTRWRMALGIQRGDLVICPDGVSVPVQLRIGKVIGGYQYHEGAVLSHRRAVAWHPTPMRRADMSPELQNSSGSISTIVDLSGYDAELSALMGGAVGELQVAQSELNAQKFGLEKELENFLVANWNSTELGQTHDLYKDEASSQGGQQYPTSVGPIDLLAVKKDKSEYLVIELKRGRASDVVIGQIQRYMGFIAKEVAEEGQKVRGLIIALEDDPKLQYALLVAPNISFYTYQISFALRHAGGLTF